MKTRQIMMLTLLMLGISLAREAQAFYNPSAGRWLSRDPIEEDGGNNLYAMISNDLINKANDLGQYEADFHFYVIYYLLRAKCFSPEDANAIAYFSQFVDDNPATDPMRLGETGQYAKLAQYHFINSTWTRATQIADPMAMVSAFVGLHGWATGNQDPQAVGTSLHTLADTWAHHDFTAYPRLKFNGASNHPDLHVKYPYAPPIGHAQFGHRPDCPYLRQSLALDAADTIYNLIPSQGCGCQPLPLSTVNSDLSSQFSYAGSEYDRSVAASLRITMRFGDLNVWDSDHRYDTEYDPGQ